MKKLSRLPKNWVYRKRTEKNYGLTSIAGEPSVNITSQVKQCLRESGIREGILPRKCHAYLSQCFYK